MVLTLMGADGSRQVVAIHQRHAAIDDDDIEAAVEPGIQAGLAIMGSCVLKLQVVQLL
ncbi:hypothetical protein D9M71_122600 [compost metagenome]